MSRVTTSTDFDRVKPEELSRYLSIFAQDVVAQLNNGLNFDTNMDCKLVSITFSAAATDTSVAHGLGRAPTGYIPYGFSAPMSIYDGTVSSSTILLTLRSSAAGVARLIVF